MDKYFEDIIKRLEELENKYDEAKLDANNDASAEFYRGGVAGISNAIVTVRLVYSRYLRNCTV